LWFQIQNVKLNWENKSYYQNNGSNETYTEY